MKEIKGLRPFGRFIMTIGQLPASYLVSMTYEEQLIWLCNYLQNTVIPTVNNNGEAVEELQNLFVELKQYVDDYFENLDVQEEIDNKLDEMAESGELADIIAQFLGVDFLFTYNTAADLAAATTVKDGSNAYIMGKDEYNDGKGAFYKIREIKITDVIDGDNIIAITSSEDLVAEKLPNYFINEINTHLDNLDIEVDIIYDTLADLLADTNLYADKNVKILGYYSVNDGGGAFYKIREALENETANGITTYDTDNELIAEIIDNSRELYAKKYGVKCDKTSDDSSRLQTIINYCKSNNKTLVLDGYAYVSSTIDTKGIKIKGLGKPAEAYPTYTSSTYGYIGWDYLRNQNNGALITFSDYLNDVVHTGSGFVSDTANPILTCYDSDGKFDLENLCICGWIRTNNQIGIASTYSGSPGYINGHHRFINVNVINCGGTGIKLQSLEGEEQRDLRCLFNFGYGLYIEGVSGIDTPFEYVNFERCRFAGNRLGNVYALNSYRKQVLFNECNFNSSGLYKQLGIALPASTTDIIPGVKIEGVESSTSNKPRFGFIMNNCYAEETNLFISILTSGGITNGIELHDNICYTTETDNNNCFLYLDTMYSDNFVFYNNFLTDGAYIKVNGVGNLISSIGDKNYYGLNLNTRELSLHANLSPSIKSMKRYGSIVQIDVDASASANIAAYQNIMSSFPKPISTIYTTCLIGGSPKRLAVYANGQCTINEAISSGQDLKFHLVYFTKYQSDKDGN